MSEFWVDADTKNGGKVAGLSDSEVMDTLRGKADEAHEAGNLHSEAGIRKAMDGGADTARRYLAMMRVVGRAARNIKATS
jgi:hypothetical protein